MQFGWDAHFVLRCDLLEMCSIHDKSRNLFLRFSGDRPLCTQMPRRLPITDSKLDCSAPKARSLSARTAGLFSLLAATCGGSSRNASLAMGRDIRAIRRVDDTPTLAHISNLGHALGIRPADALGVIAHRAAVCASFDSILDEIARADAADDATQLEILAGVLADSLFGHAEHLRALPLSLLVFARAAASRGEVRHALAFAHRAQRLGLDLAHPLTLQLIDVIDGEALLGAPWIGGQVIARQRLQVDRGGGFGSQRRRPASPEGLLAARTRCFASAELILTSCPPFINKLDTVANHKELGALRMALDLGATVRHASDGAATHIWTASIVGHIAHRLLEQHWCDKRLEKAALALAVQASLTLEDELLAAKNEVQQLACARRARLVLSEWASRSARNELVGGVFDDVDYVEFRSACVRFPQALECEHLRQRGDVPFENFHKTSILGLDMLSDYCPMHSQPLTQSSQARAAHVNHRSEDLC